MAVEKDIIDLKLSRGTEDALAKLERGLGSADGKLEQMLKTAQEFQSAMKAIRLEQAAGAKAAESNLAALNKYLRGVQNIERLKAAKTRDMGVTGVAQAAQASQNKSQSSAAGRGFLQEAENDRILNMNLKERRKTLKEINDLKELGRAKDEATQRLGWAIRQQDRESIRDAKKLVAAVEDRVAAIRNATAARKLEEEAAKRTAALQKANPFGTTYGNTIMQNDAAFRNNRTLAGRVDNSDTLFRAKQLNLTSEIQNLERINTLEALRERRAETLARLDLAKATRDKTDIRNAEELLRLMKERQAVLKYNTTGDTTGAARAEAELIRRRERATAKQIRDEQVANEARNMNMRAEERNARRLQTSEEALRRTALARLRLEQERASSNARGIAQAERLLDVLKRQTAQLRIQETRQAMKDRLFGDGGASLFQVQAGLAANYAIMGGVRNMLSGSGQFIAEFDEELRNLQAIAVVTDENMGGLRGTILDVSEATKFSAEELAAASVTLGQAGFSIKQIESSLSAVALLATATNTSLEKSVDIVTSVLGVFSKDASQLIDVTHTLTAAINGSKLSMDKIALGIQYAGNTAAQSNISFEEMVASMGAMANAGIRSGSTLGTGMRQILISLQKPSKQFRETLDRLGLSISDVDVRTKGLYGVMQTLQNAGFSSADAIKSFQIRAASAFNAMAGNIDQVLELEESFLHSAAAAEANETQMRALTNQAKRFTANFNAVVATGVEPLTFALRDVISGLADLMEGLRQAPAIMQGVITAGTAVVSTFALFRGLKLVGYLTGIAGALAGVTAAGGTAATILAAITGPIGFIATAAGIAALSWVSYSNEIARAAEATEKAQTAFDNATGGLEETASKIDVVGERIRNLRMRADELNGELLDLEIKKVEAEFASMGIEIDENVDTVGELIGRLRDLQLQLQEKYHLDLTGADNALTAVQDLIAAQNNEMATNLSAAKGVFGRRVSNPDQGKRGGRTISRGELYPNIVEGLRGLDSPDVRQRDIQQVIMAVRSEMEGANSIERRALASVVESLNNMQSALTARQGSEREAQNLQKDTALQEALLQNADAVDKVQALAAGLLGKVQQAGDAAATPREGMLAARSANDAAQQAIKTLLADLPENVQKDLRSSVMQAFSEGDQEAGRYADDFLGQSEQTSEAQGNTYEIRKARLERRMELAKRAEEVDAALAEIQQLELERAQQRREELTAEAVAGDRPLNEVELTEQSQLNAETQKDLTANNDAARKRRVELANNQLADYERQLDTLSKELETAATEGDARQIGSQMQELADAMTLVEQTVSANTDGGLKGLTEKVRDRNKEITDEVNKQVAELANLNMDSINRMVANTRREMEEATSADQIEELRTELNDLAEQRAQEKRESADLLIANVAARTNAMEEIDAALAEEIRGNNKAALEAQIREMEEDQQRSQTLLDEVLLLAETAITADKRAELQKKAALLATQIAEQGQAIASKQGELDPDNAETYDLQAALSALRQQATIKDAFKPKKNGSGAGGSKAKEKTETQKLIDQFKGQVQTARILSQAGDYDVNKLNGFFQPVMDQYGKNQTQIADYAGRSNLSKEDQEKFNDLLRDQKTLESEIKSKREEAVQILFDQGQYMEGIQAQTALWAQENLNLSETLRSGVASALDGITSNLGSMFSDILSGTKSATEAFQEFGKSTLKSLTDIIGKMLAIYAMQTLLKGFGFGGGGDTGGGVMDIFKAATGMNDGGEVKGSVNRDSVPTLLRDGEVVMRKSAVDLIGKDNLLALNAQGNRVQSNTREAGRSSSLSGQSNNSGAPRDLNLYLLDERSAAPSLGPNDVLAVVNDDISRGGTTKKLIKQLQLEG